MSHSQPDIDPEDYDFESRYADDLEALQELESETPCDDYRYPFSPRQDATLAVQVPVVSQDGANSDKPCWPSERKRHSSCDVDSNEKNGHKSKISPPCRKRICLDIEPSTRSVAMLLDDSRPGTSRQHNWETSASWDYMPVTGSDGVRVRLLLKEECIYNEDLLKFPASQSLRLLSKSYWNLRDEIERERENHLCWDESNTVAPVEMQTAEVQEMLWVEKYKPHDYVELLSDDGINRSFLRWLKTWDKAVFGREVKVRNVKKEEKKNVQIPAKKNHWVKKPETDPLELDGQGRPLHKVALLSGPPGLGKTTLAHVIAKHAGYNVVEMNASDDRTPEVFRTRLEAATQMKAVMGQDPKPNCLIIDEIDGAPAPSVDVLVSCVKSSGHSKGRRNKGELPPLSRPIICVCNDQYVPALKPLRQVSLILNFPPTLSARLASRLQEITRQESLKADLSALLALCGKADNDIRSCLSTLQFLHGRRSDIRISDIQTVSVGQKDVQKSLFSVWQDIFYLPRSKQPRKTDVVDQTRNNEDTVNGQRHDATKPTARCYDVLGSVYGCGDYEKLLQGIHENYLLVGARDPRLELMEQGTEWLCFTDIIQQEIAHRQLYNLLPYLPYGIVAFHLLFATLTYPKLKYPSSYFEYRTKKTQMTNIVGAVFADASILVRRVTDPTMAVMDLLPQLLHIIQPIIRPVNTQLYSEREKSDLAKVINTMICYNLSYRQERTAEGHYQYVLEPNIEDLLTFPGIKLMRSLTYAAKQLIAREVELEQMRRNESTMPVAKVTKKQNITNSVAAPDVNSKLRAPKVSEEKPALDFFGREVRKTIPESKKDTAAENSRSGTVWFRFKEGFSNAVRKTVRIQDLL